MSPNQAIMEGPTPGPNVDILLSKISSNYSLFLKRSWLASTLASSSSLSTTTSENSLLASLKFRITASDFKESLHPHKHTCFLIEGGEAAEMHNINLSGPIAVQVVEVVDLGTSKSEQLERIEEAERGEIRKGRQIIRVVTGVGEDEENEGIGTQPAGVRSARQQPVQPKSSAGPHKLLLEDAAGNRAYGFEIERIDGIKTTMGMGAKLVLRNVPVARGLLLLSPTNTSLLGGRIEAWNQRYLATRKDKLRESIEKEKA